MPQKRKFEEVYPPSPDTTADLWEQLLAGVKEQIASSAAEYSSPPQP